MNIGIVCYPTYGGSGVVATELGKELAERGHTIHFITYDRPVRLSGYAPGIFYHQVIPANYPLFPSLPYETALAGAIVDVAKYAGLDMLHVHYAIPHASSAYLAQQILKTKGILLPFITTLHGTDITLVGKEKSYEPVVTFAMNQSNGLTSVSDYLRRATYENFSIDKEIEVIPNFINLGKYEGQRDRKQTIRNCIADCEEKILLHASNFRKVKRVQDVYQIYLKIRERMPAKLMLLGDGPERSVLERQVREDGLQQDVLFLGHIDNITEILPLGDVFLLPSETESFGLAALEAMACGVPVVASDSGGLPEVVEHGRSGFLAPVGDVAQMAEYVATILSDQPRWSTFSEAARARAKVFSHEHIVSLYEAFYERVRAEFGILHA